MRPFTVVHVITDLEVGGAEMVLLRLLQTIDRARFRAGVVSLDTDGPLGPRFEALDIPVRELNLRGGNGIRNLVRLVESLRGNPPDLVQTWMYHADLVGGLAGRFAAGSKVVWGVHQTDLPSDGIKRATRMIAATNRVLAKHVPDHIVFCSEASARHHRSLGYPTERSSVIPNGFAITPEVDGARHWLRDELGLAPEIPLVGRVGRFHAQKDFRTFIDSARLVAERLEAHFVACGRDVTPRNRQLMSWVEQAGLTGRVHLLGLRDDVDRINAGLDVAVSSSAFGEAFPLVIGEAMLQQVPVVATDVGDSRRLVGETGEIVPPRDPLRTAEAILKILQEPEAARRRRGERARQRIVERYSLNRMTTAYERLYETLARGGVRPNVYRSGGHSGTSP